MCLISGRTGALLKELTGDPVAVGQFGLSLDAGEDADRDGKRDLLVDTSWGSGHFFIFSERSGWRLIAKEFVEDPAFPGFPFSHEMIRMTPLSSGKTRVMTGGSAWDAVLHYESD